MTHPENIKFIAETHELSQASAKAVIATFLENIQATVALGGDYAIKGFGTFKRGHRAARTGRNPRDGSKVEIAAANTFTFSAGSESKALVNK